MSFIEVTKPFLHGAGYAPTVAVFLQKARDLILVDVVSEGELKFRKTLAPRAVSKGANN